LNEAENLEGLSNEIGPQLREGDEVIIVDGHSTDGTSDVARCAGFRVIPQRPQGLGSAKTHGGRHATNEVLVFLDADCHISEGYLETVREHFRNGEVDAVGGIMRYSWKSPRERRLYRAYGELFFHLPKAIHRLTGKYGMPSNNMAIRRELFLRAGGYRSVVAEDFDLMLRMKPSRRARFDRRMEVELSSRRFEEKGFFRTTLFWIVSGLRVALGNGLTSAGYRAC
jgi:glycosyltransferase involved in cell wall biosynthesis